MLDAATRFMERVLPWPGDDSAPGYVNLHWRGRTPAEGYPGRPFRSAADLMNSARWSLAHFDKTPDLYFCMSLQAASGTSKRTGKQIAVRNQQNALSLKSFWIDIDVKDPPKGYATLEEAAVAFTAFRDKCGLPKPSAIIKSGGGLHIYWITDDPMPVEVWRPTAEALKNAVLTHGLRCDAGCTVDAARLLRVPDTWNCKVDPKRPVKILAEGDTYAKEVITDAVAGYSTPSTTAAPARSVDAALFPARQLPARYSALQGAERASAGVEHRDPIVLDTKAIVRGCAFIRDALQSGGKLYDQPQWNLTTLCATFLEDGHALAHGMSRGHPDYRPETTDQLWHRKVSEVAKGLKWPSCKAIQTAGCGSCATCPHFAAGKSPLHLGLGKISTALPPAKATPPGLPTAADLDLPDGYSLDNQGRVCIIVFDKESGENREMPLFDNVFTKPWAQAGPPSSALNFLTTADLGRTNPVMLEAAVIHSMDMFKVIYDAGVRTIDDIGRKYAGRFFMSWLSKIEKKKQAQATRPFGWEMLNETTPKAFVFGDKSYRVDGTNSPCGYRDPVMRSAYEPRGDIKQWLLAAKFVTDQKRPPLDVLLASAFAAPLTIFGGQHGCFLSAYGESGKGKSTTLKIAQAVWARPNIARQVLDSTANSLSHILGKLANLPLYWDEIKDTESRAKLAKMVFSVTMGKEKDRMKGDGGLRAAGEWHTLLIGTMNKCFVDFLTKAGQTDVAGLYRVFEYEVPHKDRPAGVSTHWDVDALVGSLEYNNGAMGEAYVQLMVSRYKDLYRLVREEGQAFDAIVGTKDEERYWSKFVATTLVGARFANELGCEFDLDVMRDFLAATFIQMRNVIEGEVGKLEDNMEDTLTRFLKEHAGATLVTNTMHQRIGVPGRGMVQVLVHPAHNGPRGIQVQWVKDDPRGNNKLMVSSGALYDWVEAREGSITSTVKGFKKIYGAKRERATLGAGTIYSRGQESVVVFNILPGSPLWATLKTLTAGATISDPLVMKAGADELTAVTPPPSQPVPANAGAAREP